MGLDTCGRNSSFGTATLYGLGGPGIEARYGRNFSYRPDQPRGPLSRLYKGHRLFPEGKAAAAHCRPLISSYCQVAYGFETYRRLTSLWLHRHVMGWPSLETWETKPSVFMTDDHGHVKGGKLSSKGRRRWRDSKASFWCQTVRARYVMPPLEPLCRDHLTYDGTRTETRFPLSAKRTSPFQSAGQGGGQFSRLLAAEVCTSAVVMLDTPRSEVVWRVLATHCIRQFPLHFPFRASPCPITFQLEYTRETLRAVGQG